MKEYFGNFNADGMAIGIVVSRSNENVSKSLLEEALDCLKRHGVDDEEMAIAWVPGPFEIPLVAHQMALSGKFDAVICLGAIIRSEPNYNEHIAAQAAAGIAHASLESGIPVIFGVLNTDTAEQALERSGIKFGNKGFEAAMSAIEMFNLSETMLLDLYETDIATIIKEQQLEEEQLFESATPKNGKKLTRAIDS